jgi:hypothetical protein
MCPIWVTTLMFTTSMTHPTYPLQTLTHVRLLHTQHSHKIYKYIYELALYVTKYL